MRSPGMVIAAFALAGAVSAGRDGFSGREARADEARFLVPSGARLVPDAYVVVLRPGVAAPAGAAGLSVSQLAVDLAVRHGGQATFFYEHALQGFAVRLSEKAARLISTDARVAYVQQEQELGILATQANPPVGLDRIDQRDLPLDQSYTFDFTGAAVHAYIIDTGIRATHQEVAGRIGNGFTAVNDGNGTNDCNGHGTHVAGIVGGTTFGVAKQVTLHPVRVLACNGSASTSQVLAGIDFVTGNHVKPAVANLSLGSGTANTALDDAVRASINAGVTYVVAAGGSNSDACNTSPARVTEALTTMASDRNDAKAAFSSFGSCADLFAPGVGITSATIASDTATSTLSGTSMATAHVTGTAALFLHQNGHQPASTVHAAIVNNATTGRITGVPPGTPNRLLFSRFGQPPPPPPTVVFFDDFEASRGWVPNPNGTDTATTGRWERGDPQATNVDGPKQLGNAVSGLNDLVTGRLAGTGPSAHDVDGGVTSVGSPAITLPSSGVLTLSFSYYLAHRSNSSSADFFRVRVIAGATNRVVFQELGGTEDDDAVWATASVDLGSFAGQSIRLLIEAGDLAGASLVEAAVDDVRITRR